MEQLEIELPAETNISYFRPLSSSSLPQSIPTLGYPQLKPYTWLRAVIFVLNSTHPPRL